MRERIDRFFSIRARGSALGKEVLAGVSTFLALSYIFVVNPAILAQGGMPPDAVMFATIVTSAMATLAMGLWARLPFALAPGMEMNSYVAFYVIGGLGFTWQEALGAVFWSGVLFLLFTVSKVRQRIIDAIPDPMKVALSLSVGAFLMLIALRVAGVLEYAGVRLAGVGPLLTPLSGAFAFSLVVTLVLDRFGVRAAVLIGIVATTLFCHALHIGIDRTSAHGLSDPMEAFGQLDIQVILQPRVLSAVLVLFLIDFYGSVAKLIGLSRSTTLIAAGRLPRLENALLIDGVATTFGAGLGTSSLTVYVESGVGIGAGGRTGLVAVVCGILMALCLLLTPYLQLVPVVAATGALVLVGLKLFPTAREFAELGILDRVIVVMMPLVVVLTFALDRAMLAGALAYVGHAAITRKAVNVFLLLSAVLLAIGVLLQTS